MADKTFMQMLANKELHQGLNRITASEKPVGDMSDEELDAYVANLSEEELQELEAKVAGMPSQVDSGIIQEMHPAFSKADRALIKNLGTNLSQGVQYLKEKYPKMEVDIQEGQIVGKKKGEEKWRVLDPNTGFISQDILNDVTDIGVDLARGAAAVPAMTFGGAVGGPVGAAAAGAVAMGGSEALREKLGQALGLPNRDLDKLKIGLEATLGAAGPLAEKGAGVAYRVVTRQIAPSKAEALTGVSSEIWKRVLEDPKKVMKLESDPAAFEQVLREVSETATQGMLKRKSDVGSQFGKIMKDAGDRGEMVDVAAVKRVFDKPIAEAEQAFKELGSPAAKQRLDDFKALKEELVSKIPVEEGAEVSLISDTISPKAASQLKEDINVYSQPYRLAGAGSKIKDPTNKAIHRTASEAAKKLDDEIKKIDPALPKLSREYHEALKESDMVVSSFKDDATTFRTAGSWDAQAKEVLKAKVAKALGKEEGEKLSKGILDIQVKRALGDPSQMPLSTGGTTSTSRSMMGRDIGGAAGAIGGRMMGGDYTSVILGREAGEIAGGRLASPAAFKERFMRLGRTEEALRRKATPAKQTFYGTTLSTWGAIPQGRQE